jgi:hypothetical protein
MITKGGTQPQFPVLSYCLVLHNVANDYEGRNATAVFRAKLLLGVAQKKV